MQVVHYDTHKKLMEIIGELEDVQQRFMLNVLRARSRESKYAPSISTISGEDLLKLAEWVKDKPRGYHLYNFNLTDTPLSIALIQLALPTLSKYFVHDNTIEEWIIRDYLGAAAATQISDAERIITQLVSWKVNNLPKGHQRWSNSDREANSHFVLPANREEAVILLMRGGWDIGKVRQLFSMNDYDDEWKVVGNKKGGFVLYSDIYEVLATGGNTDNIHARYEDQELVGSLV